MDHDFGKEIKGKRLMIGFDVKWEDIGSEISRDGYFSLVTPFKLSKPLIN